MSSRKMLVASTLALLIVGLLLALIPFVGALSPDNAKALAALPRIDVSHIQPGETLLMAHPRSSRWNSYLGVQEEAIFFLRKTDGTLKAWYVLRIDGDQIGMPDMHWWRPGFRCRSFGPTYVGGRLDERQPLDCHDRLDENLKAWSARLKWTVDGKSLYPQYASDMLEVKGHVDGKYFVYGKASP